MAQATSQGSAAPKVPTTQLEMLALQMQRGELKDQLAGLNRRRSQLQEQRSGMEGAAARDNDLRIREIDQRTSEIDQTLMRLDVAIADGLAKPLFDDVTGNDGPAAVRSGQAQSGSPGLLPPPPRWFSRDAERAVILGGLAFTAVAVYAIWLGARRYFMKTSASSIEGQARRLDQLQQSVDVIAVEVERMSESQRFVAKVLHEKFPALGVGEAQPVGQKAKDAAKL